jgi:hypothetical protein
MIIIIILTLTILTTAKITIIIITIATITIIITRTGPRLWVRYLRIGSPPPSSAFHENKKISAIRILFDVVTQAPFTP